MEIVYATTRHPLMTKSRKFINAGFYDGVVEGASKVYVDPAFPAIAKAYEEAGVEVQIIGEEKPKLRSRQKPAEETSPT